MSTEEIYEYFINCFPAFKENVSSYESNLYGASILIHMKNGYYYIFSITMEKDLESNERIVQQAFLTRL